MPGKVNPVIPEVVTQVAAQVIGNDTAIAIGGMQGHFELNVFVPLIARNLLDSIKLLASASRLLAEKCVDGIEANRETLRALRRADALGGDRPQPVHRLRQGGRDRQGGRCVGPLAARGRARGRSRGGRPGRGARLPQDGQAARLTLVRSRCGNGRCPPRAPRPRNRARIVRVASRARRVGRGGRRQCSENGSCVLGAKLPNRVESRGIRGARTRACLPQTACAIAPQVAAVRVRRRPWLTDYNGRPSGDGRRTHRNNDSMLVR